MKTSLNPQSGAPFDPENRNQRGLLARAALLAVFGILLATFFRLQVVEHASHVERATNNQVRTIPLPAPRGFVYDRDGEVIAENVPAYSVSLLPASNEELSSSIDKIGSILEFDEHEIEALTRQYQVAPGQISTTAHYRNSKRSAATSLACSFNRNRDAFIRTVVQRLTSPVT